MASCRERGTRSSSRRGYRASEVLVDDPFAILEVPRDASDDDIKRAYRRLAKAHHPDRYPGDPEAAERFKRIASAFEVLGDADRRAAWLRDNGIAPGASWPAAFTAVVEDAIDRAQSYIEGRVLPHYARHWRGAGAEAAVRLWQDAASLAEVGFLADETPPDLLARRRAAWWTRRIEITMEDWPMTQASHRVRLRSGTHRIVVLPFALWHGQIRDSTDVDNLVLQLLVARYAQIWGDRSGALRLGEGPQAIARAREIDDLEARQQRVGTAMTVGLVLVVTVLVYSGLAGW